MDALVNGTPAIGTAGTSAARAKFDDLVRAAALIAVVTVHGLSARTSGPLRRKMRSMSTLLVLVWLLLVSYRLGHVLADCQCL